MVGCPSLRVLPLSFLSSLAGVACALGGCILTIMTSLAHQVTFIRPAGNCLDCGPAVTVQLGYPLPWLWYGASTGFGLTLSPLRVDLWAFSANFAAYSLSLLGIVWASGIAIGYLKRASGITVSYLKRRGYLERFVLDILVITTIVFLIFLFWWPLIF